MNPRFSCRVQFAWLCLSTLIAGVTASQIAIADDLLDRYASLPAIWSAKLSPDGRHLALGCSREGMLAACILSVDDLSQAPRVFLPKTDERLTGINWAGSDWLLLNFNSARDARGMTDNLRLIPTDRATANNIQTGESASMLRNGRFALNLDLTDVAAAPASAPGSVFMRLQDYGDDYSLAPRTMIYRVDLRSGIGKLFRSGTASTFSWLVGPDASPIIRLDVDPPRGRIVVNRATGQSAEKLCEFGYDPKSIWSVGGMTADGRQLALEGFLDSDARSISLLDVESCVRAPLAIAPENTDIAGFISDGSSDAVVGVGYTDDLPRQHFIDPALDKAQREIQALLPGHNVLLQSWSNDRSSIALSAAAANAPAEYYLFHPATRALAAVGAAHPQLSALPLPTTTHLQYAARDGLQINAYLTLPPGKSAKDGPFPLLLFPHGGPAVRDDASFEWWSAYYAQRGYAILRPNFRGSTGYGLAFQRQGFGEFGGRMIEDVIDGARHLISIGVATPARICTIGASYGGYAALMVAVREPVLTKCVVAFAPVTDPTGLIADRSKLFGRNSGVIRFWEEYIGSRFRSRRQIAAASVALNAQAITVPVLLLHGTQDTNVPFSQSDYLRKQLASVGGNVRLVQLTGNDHYLGTAAVRRTVLTEIDAFLRQHLPI